MPQTDRKAYNQRIRDEQKERGFRRVSVTLSPDEFVRFESGAETHNTRVTTYVKQCALAHLDTEYLVPPDLRDRLDGLLAVLRGIGNNLNQLARYSNEMRYFLETHEVRLQLRRMDEAVRQFVESPVIVKSPESTDQP